MSDVAYTTAQVHHRLGVPKPTIRNWSAEYAPFLSERARPDDGKTRLFTYDDLILLNTVRYLTRVEGLNNNDHIRQILASGRRVADLPRQRSTEEEEALEAVELVPVAQLERALDKVRLAEAEVDRVSREAKEVADERDEALLALDDANRRMAALREKQGRLHGILVGVSAAGIGLALLILAAIVGAALYVTQIQP